jgi:hypothetical protein
LAITVVYPEPAQSHGSPRAFGELMNLRDCNVYRWSLSISLDNDAFSTGLTGIVEAAITGTRTRGVAGANPVVAGPSVDASIASISAAGVVTFSISAPVTLDLIVWAK